MIDRLPPDVRIVDDKTSRAEQEWLESLAQVLRETFDTRLIPLRIRVWCQRTARLTAFIELSLASRENAVKMARTISIDARVWLDHGREPLVFEVRRAAIDLCSEALGPPRDPR